MRLCVCMRMKCVSMCVYIHVYVCMYVYLYVCTHVCVYVCVYSHLFTCKRSGILVYTYLARIYVYTHACSARIYNAIKCNKHIHTCTQTCVHAYEEFTGVYVYVEGEGCVNTHTHTDIHINTYKNIHTYILTHMQWTFVSCGTGIRKPDPKSYQIVCERYVCMNIHTYIYIYIYIYNVHTHTHTCTHTHTHLHTRT